MGPYSRRCHKPRPSPDSPSRQDGSPLSLSRDRTSVLGIQDQNENGDRVLEPFGGGKTPEDYLRSTRDPREGQDCTELEDRVVKTITPNFGVRVWGEKDEGDSSPSPSPLYLHNWVSPRRVED